MDEELQSGDRVYLAHPSPVLALRSPLGTLKALDAVSGYWTVDLDEPADYINAEGETRHLTSIREHAENMRRVAAMTPPSARPGGGSGGGGGGLLYAERRPDLGQQEPLDRPFLPGLPLLSERDTSVFDRSIEAHPWDVQGADYVTRADHLFLRHVPSVADVPIVSLVPIWYN